MKKVTISGCVAVVMMITFSGCAPRPYSTLTTVSANVTFQSFYDDLLEFGIWIDYPGYGQVWHPRVDDFRPYATNGYWIYSSEGWTWVSGYSWGWGPFHYGRWLYDDLYGWLWIPGYEWSPAWVTWGYIDDYFAWAPLMPDVDVYIHFHLWRPNNFYWNVCPRRHIYDRDLPARIERPDRFQDFDRRVSVIENFNPTRTNKQFYSKGPEPVEVEKYTNRKVEVVSLKTVRKVNPAVEMKDEKKVFRPVIRQYPTPREYKRVENEKISPIRNDHQRPALPKVEQKKNIDKLPVYKPIVPSQKGTMPVKKIPSLPRRPGQ